MAEDFGIGSFVKVKNNEDEAFQDAFYLLKDEDNYYVVLHNEAKVTVWKHCELGWENDDENNFLIVGPGQNNVMIIIKLSWSDETPSDPGLYLYRPKQGNTREMYRLYQVEDKEGLYYKSDDEEDQPASGLDGSWTDLTDQYVLIVDPDSQVKSVTAN